MRKFLISGLACALPLIAVAAGSARADTLTAVPQLSNFHQMVADGAAGYLFLSGNGEIVVTDLAGAYGHHARFRGRRAGPRALR